MISLTNKQNGAQRFSPTHGHARHASEWEWVAATWAPLLYAEHREANKY